MKIQKLLPHIECEICKKSFPIMGIGTHVWRVHGEGKDFIPSKLHKKGAKAWNCGLTKETDNRIAKYAVSISKTHKKKVDNGTWSAPRVSDEFREKARKNAYRRCLGGHTSKKRMDFTKKDGTIVHLQSSYEVSVAASLEENGIKWSRPSALEWIDENLQKHRYYADFYLHDYNIYLDPKNDFLIVKDTKKISAIKEQNNVNVIVLDSKSLSWEKIQKMLL